VDRHARRRVEVLTADFFAATGVLRVLSAALPRGLRLAKEKQDEMFPKCRQSAMDLKALGTRLAARKAELMAEMSAGMEVS
jgi:hypothetical protein